jgi:hypothetical protein
MIISRQPFPGQIMTDQKQPENGEYFIYLFSITTNDERCTHVNKTRTAMARAGFNKKKTLIIPKSDLNLTRN